MSTSPPAGQQAQSLVCGVGECVFSREGRGLLSTYALGSCIAVSAWDPATRAGALLHFMLPEAALNPEKAAKEPHVFADSGLKSLWGMLEAAGLNLGRIQFNLAGGAAMLGPTDFFGIGKKNMAAAKNEFWKKGLFWEEADCGGGLSRNLSLDLESGLVTISSRPLGVQDGGTHGL